MRRTRPEMALRRLRALSEAAVTFDQDLHRLRVTAGMAAIQASRGRYDRVATLWDAEVSVFSQWGEDGIVDYLLEMLQISRPRCLEIGVGDYSEANTRFLVETRSAPAVIIDSNPELRARLALEDIAWRGDLTPVSCFIDRDGVDSLVTGLFGDERPDLVSLDIDGVDYWVLERIPLEGTAIVICEFNALLGHRSPVSVPYSPTFSRWDSHYSGLYYGASLPAMVHLLASRGFALMGTTRSCVNAFFVRSDLATQIPVEPLTPQDYPRHTARLIRDSRARDGRLDFLPPAQQRHTIADLPVVDVRSGRSLTVAEASAGA